MKILITGGAGFIGSHTADRLLARGDRVCVIDNYATGRRDNLRPHPHLTSVEGSIADGTLVARTFDAFGPDRVMHAAASYRDPTDWEEDVRTNLLGTVHVVRASMRSRVTRLVYFQTALCYGLQPSESPITLTHPLRPEGSSYAISKTAAEDYVRLGALDYVSLRLANAYGPRNLSGPLPTFFQRLSNGQTCYVMRTRRDFVFIDDLVEIVLMALDGTGGPGAYHVSSGADHAIADLYHETRAAMGLPPDPGVEVRDRGPDDAFSILLDPTQTVTDFAWRPRTPLAVGVRRAIEDYRSRGLTETFTHLHPPTS